MIRLRFANTRTIRSTPPRRVALYFSMKIDTLFRTIYGNVYSSQTIIYSTKLKEKNRVTKEKEANDENKIQYVQCRRISKLTRINSIRFTIFPSVLTEHSQKKRATRSFQSFSGRFSSRSRYESSYRQTTSWISKERFTLHPSLE